MPEEKNMMNDIFAALLLLAAVWGVASGNGAEVSSAMLKSGIGTAELMLTVAGGMVMWSGIMAIAEQSGLTDLLTRVIRPLLRVIMPGLEKGSDAEKYVCMNISANILGLGNAATPPGLRAMKAMAEQNRSLNGKPSREMVTFAVLNTASVQLIPSTVMTLRSAAGSDDPGGILPCVWITSACALAAGLLMCQALGRYTQQGDCRLSEGRSRKRAAI